MVRIFFDAGDNAMFRLRKNSGFTLAELMVVIAIVAVLSALAIPGFLSWIPKHKLGNGSRDILSTLERARMRAVRDRISIGIEIVDDANYRVWVDNGAGAGETDNAQWDVGENIIMQSSLPAGITADLGGGASSFRFDSQGYPLDTNDLPFTGKLKLTNGRHDRYVHMSVAGNAKISKDENP